MDFKFNGRGKITLNSTNEDLKKQWSVMSVKDAERTLKMDFSDLEELVNSKRERTNIALVVNKKIKEPALIRTINYRAEDLKTTEAILQRRRIIFEQVNILNNINSTFLPRALAYFNINNDKDTMGEEVRGREPALILELKEGAFLDSIILSNELYEKERPGEINISKICRTAKTILKFLGVLNDKGYAHLALSLEHILFNNYDDLSFIGLGRICSLKNGVLNSESVNFSRTVLGYSAPELNNPSLNWGTDAKGIEIGAFSLGVIIHQMISGNIKFTPKMIKGGALFYPNDVTEEKILSQDKGRGIHYLISMLCKHNVEERLCEYNKIEHILEEIEKGIFKVPENYTNIGVKSILQSSKNLTEIHDEKVKVRNDFDNRKEEKKRNYNFKPLNEEEKYINEETIMEEAYSKEDLFKEKNKEVLKAGTSRDLDETMVQGDSYSKAELGEKLEENNVKGNNEIHEDIKIKPFIIPVKREILYKDLIGNLNFFDKNKGYGFIKGEKGENYYLRKREFSISNLNGVAVKDKLKFDVAKDESGAIFACNIKIIGKSLEELGLNDEAIDLKEREEEIYYEPSIEDKKPKEKGWCFISTAVYGTFTSSKLDDLRWFRDSIMKECNWGRALLLKYYKTSPKISHKLRGMKIRKEIIRKIIDYVAKIVKEINKEREEGKESGVKIFKAIIIYYFAYSLAYIFVLPERIFNISTTGDKGGLE